ncbi:LysR family glycine cleavage system transcriptional activator [Sphingomonas sp. UYAg733]
MSAQFTLLHTFVEVARAGRMKAAALSLGVTPGAVSQRIGLLEERVGRRLFVRNHAGVELNPAGAAMFAELNAPFELIESVDRRLSARSSPRVVVSVMASFAASWLVPRLGEFAARDPEIEIAVETDPRLVDLRREPVDLAIRHGLGNYPGLEVAWLLSPELIVVASPALLRAGMPIRSPADCLSYPLLHDIDRHDWRLWFEAHDVSPALNAKGPAFSDDHLMVRAAVAGQGLALVRNVYAEDDLRSGRLVRALTLGWPTRLAYYAVTTREALQRPAVRRLRDWLIDEARKPMADH